MSKLKKAIQKAKKMDGKGGLGELDKNGKNNIVDSGKGGLGDRKFAVQPSNNMPQPSNGNVLIPGNKNPLMPELKKNIPQPSFKPTLNNALQNKLNKRRKPLNPVLNGPTQNRPNVNIDPSIFTPAIGNVLKPATNPNNVARLY